MIYAFYIAEVIIAVIDRIEANNDEDPDRKTLDLYPLYVAIVCIITRCFIIAIRYGTSAVGIYLGMSTGAQTPEQVQERLMSRAWIVMPPEVMMLEIEKAMVKVGATEKFFKFKTLTPIYPTMKQKLVDPDYWAKFEWTHAKAIK